MKVFAESSSDELRDIASKLVVLHGLDPTKRSFATLLCDGISFAVSSPENLPFLTDGLHFFAARSSASDANQA